MIHLYWISWICFWSRNKNNNNWIALCSTRPTADAWRCSSTLEANVLLMTRGLSSSQIDCWCMSDRTLSESIQFWKSWRFPGKRKLSWCVVYKLPEFFELWQLEWTVMVSFLLATTIMTNWNWRFEKPQHGHWWMGKPLFLTWSCLTDISKSPDFH